jgi:integrase
MHPKPTRRARGQASLFPRTDRAGRVHWYGQWWAGGKPVMRAIGLKRAPGVREGLTRAQAEVKLQELRATTAVPGAHHGPALTIAELGERYQLHLKHQGRKRTTIRAVESALRVQLVPFFADKAIHTITFEMVTDLVAVLEARDLSPKSVHNYVGVQSAMFNYAKAPRRRWVTTNPCEGVELPAVPEPAEFRFFEQEQIEAVLRAIEPGPYEAIDRAFILTAAMAGLRHGELCALRWRDVDWTAARIRVRQNWVLGDFDTPKSRRGSRAVPMADRLAGELDRLFTALGAPDDGALVFTDPTTAAPLDKARNLRRFRRALEAAGADLTHNIQDLRHTFGTRMAAAGVPMRTVQEWMGHRDYQTTLRYADYAPSLHEAALVEAAFAPRGINRASNGAKPSEPTRAQSAQ